MSKRRRNSPNATNAESRQRHTFAPLPKLRNEGLSLRFSVVCQRSFPFSAALSESAASCFPPWNASLLFCLSPFLEPKNLSLSKLLYFHCLGRMGRLALPKTMTTRDCNSRSSRRILGGMNLTTRKSMSAMCMCCPARGRRGSSC